LQMLNRLEHPRALLVFNREALVIPRLRPFCFLLFLLIAKSVWAVNPDHRISQYGHTAWHVRDGVFSGSPNAIAQTADGYLWVGTQVGLVRFDGVRFVPWNPPNENLSYTGILSLQGASDGSLWIGTQVGLMQWKDGRLIKFPEVDGYVNSIYEDREGVIWVARSRKHVGGLCRVAESKATCYGSQDGVQLDAGAVTGDGSGNLWVGSSAQITRWNPGSSTVYAPPGLKSAAGLSGVSALVAEPDGSIWIGITRSGRGLGLQRLAQGDWEPFVTPNFDSSALNVNGLLLDRRHVLWIGTEGDGVYRIHDGEVDHFRRADGLSSDAVAGFFEDKEGNLWVATSEGIDCFRDLRVVNISAREGLNGDKVASVFASRDGTVWLGNQTGLNSVSGKSVSFIGPKNGLPGVSITSLLEDHAGRLWVGVDNGLFVREGGKFTPIRRRDGSPAGVVIALTEDVDGNIWAEALGQSRYLLRIQDRTVREEIPETQIPIAVALAADPQGGIWLGFSQGGLARYRNGQLETFPLQENPKARVNQLIVNQDGSVLGATAEGLVEWRDGKLQLLTDRNGLPCTSIRTIIFDRRADLWLYAKCGLLRITADQLQKWRGQPDAAIKVNIFDVFDGVQPGFSPFQPAAAIATDGRLWFVNEKVAQVIDPADLVGNPTPPPVHIEDVIADRQHYAAGDGLRLPPLTRDLEIDYTALSLTVPQKVRFRYKLENHDADWQDANTRRQAFYSDLRPGNYRFRVMACNNDGVWNEVGAALDFTIAPAWYQTLWFRILFVVSALFVIWILYRLRLRQVARAIGVRFNERLAERTRIARELHDTLLQTVQGSKLVADDALERPDDSAHMQRAMKKLSGWLGQATQEGRAALHSLRTSTIETNDLAAGLRRAAEECLLNKSMAVKFSVAGGSRDMHPIARDEIYRIGFEAIRNACEHASASEL
jgi:ligand-binding sensor domain-containing protein